MNKYLKPLCVGVTPVVLAFLFLLLLPAVGSSETIGLFFGGRLNLDTQGGVLRHGPLAVSVGPFSSAVPLPQPVADAATASDGGNLFIAGGRSDPSALPSRVVYRAVFSKPVDSPPFLQEWVTEVNQLPEGRSRAAAVLHQNQLYVLGGEASNDGTPSDSVYRSQIQHGGSIGPWQVSDVPLPTALKNLAAVAYKGHLYLLGGLNANSNSSDTVYYSRLKPDGSPEWWTQAFSSLPRPMDSFAVAAYDDQIIISGGKNSSGAVFTDTYAAQVYSNGSLGAWMPVSPLPNPTYGHSMLAGGNMLVVAGGSTPAPGGSAAPSGLGTTRVYSLSIGPEGPLGGWSEASPLPYPVEGQAGSFAYGQVVVAGGYSGGITNSVTSALLQRDPVLKTYFGSYLSNPQYLGNRSILTRFVITADDGILYQYRTSMDGWSWEDWSPYLAGPSIELDPPRRASLFQWYARFLGDGTISQVLTATGVITAEAPPDLSGVVLAPDSTPVPNARVTLWNWDHSTHLETDANSSGAFEFSDLGARNYLQIKSFAPFHGPFSDLADSPTAMVSIYPGYSQVMTLTLQTAMFTGTVVLPQGQIVTDTDVSLFEWDTYEQDWSSLSQHRTNASGTFRLSSLPDGNYRVIANPPYRPGFSNYSQSDPLEFLSASTGVPLYLGPITLTLTAITGTVTAPDGVTPQPGVWVELYQPGGNSPRGVSAPGSGDVFLKGVSSDGAGKFQFGGLPPGTYKLAARTDSSSAYYESDFVTVEYDGVNLRANVSLALRPVDIYGQIENPDGSRAAMVHAEVRTTPTGTGLAWALSESTGNFRLGGLTSGTYYIVARAPQGSQFYDSEPRQVVFSGAPITLTSPLRLRTTPAAAFTGAVVDPAMGAPVEGARVEVRTTDWDPPVEVRGTGANGQFGLTNVVLGTTYKMTAYPPDGSPYAESAPYSWTYTGTGHITLTLSFSAIAGTVRTPLGSVITNTNVELYTADHQLHKNAWTANDGTFKFGGIPADTYRLRAHPQSGSPYAASREHEVTYSGTPVTGVALTLTLPVLTGTVTAPDMVTPVPFSNVSLHTWDYSAYADSGTGLDGKFILGGLGDGTYIVEARPRQDENLQYSQSNPIVITVTGGFAINVSQPFTIPLTAPSVTGTVLSPDGIVPISNTHVAIRSLDWTRDRHSQTNSRGNFAFGGLPGGIYNVEADSPERSEYAGSLPRQVTLVPTSTQYITILLTVPSITGTVAGPDGAPIRDAGVRVYKIDDPSVSYQTNSKPNGRYAFGHLPQGQYWLQASTPWSSGGLVPPPRKLINIPAVGAAPPETIQFTGATKHIQGRVVRPNGTPVPGAEVHANNEDGSSWTGRETGLNGVANLDVGPGAWLVSASPRFGSSSDWIYGGAPRRVEFSDTLEEITRTLVFTVTTADASIGGTVLKPDGTAPGPNTAFIHFHTPSGFGNGGRVEADGSFLVMLPQGTYLADIWIQDQTLLAPQVGPFSLGPNEDKYIGAITLTQRNSLISGAVRDSSGSGIAGIEVGAWTHEGSGWARTTTLTDGVYSLYVISGTWEVGPTPSPDSSYATSGPPQQVSIGENDARGGVDLLVVATDARIRGTVVDQGSNPLTDLYGYTFAQQESGHQGFGAPIQGGSFVLKVPAGMYVVEAGTPFGSDYTIARRTDVGVGTGGVTTITLTATQTNSWIAGHLVTDTGPSATPATGLRADVFAGGPLGHQFTQVNPDDGSYSLRVRDGEWSVNAWLDPSTGYVVVPPADNRVSAQAGLTTTFDFTIAAANSKVWGVVTGPTGTAIGGAWVEARPRAGGGGAPPRRGPGLGDETSLAGVYTITVPAGDYDIFAFLPPERGLVPPRVVTATVADDSVVQRNLRFRSADLTISGTVRITSTIAGAFVRAYSSSGGHATTNSDQASGAYQLNVAGDDTWFLETLRETGSNVYRSPLYTVTLTSTSAVQDLILNPIPTPMPEAIAERFDAATMHRIDLGDGTRIVIPPGALAISGTVTIRAVPRSTLPSQTGAKPIGIGYDLTAFDGDNRLISNFRQAVTIILRYTDQQLIDLGISEDEVVPSFYNSATGSWQEASGVVQDRNANILTFRVGHFSTWSITGKGAVEAGGEAPALPNLANSWKASSRFYVVPAQVFTYTILLANNGEANANVVVTDSLPGQIDYQPNSALASSGAQPVVIPETSRILWSGMVTANETVAITFRASVRPDIQPDQIISNTVAIDDGAGTVVTRTAIVNVTSGPDLSPSFKLAPQTVVPGGVITYEIGLRNVGVENASNARVTDTVPISTTYVNGSAWATAGTLNVTNGVLTWNGPVDTGTPVTISFRVVVDADAGGRWIPNTVEIEDGHGRRLFRTFATDVSRVPDLSTSEKTASALQVNPGVPFTYTIKLLNTGSADAGKAFVNDQLPPGTYYVWNSVTATAGLPGFSNGAITWSGAVSVGIPVTVTFRAAVNPGVPAGQVITNTAFIDDGVGPPLDLWARVTSLGGPPLSSSFKRATEVVTPGGVITYEISLRNTGPNELPNARVTDTIPMSTTYVNGSAWATAGTVTPMDGLLVWNGLVDVGIPVTISFQVVVDSTVADGRWLGNTVEIDDGQGDRRFKSAATQVRTAPDLSGSFKSASAQSVNPYEVFTYTITLVNSGPRDATNAAMTDTLPFQLSYVPNSLTSTLGTASFGNESITWNGPVSVGVPVTISFQTTAGTSNPFDVVVENTAQIYDGWRQSSKSASVTLLGSQLPPGPKPAGQVAGIVLSSQGITVPYANVEVRTREQGPALTYTPTDLQGEFAVSGLVTGTTYLFKANPPWDSTDAASDWYSLQFTETTRITLTLRTPAILGVVRDPSNTVPISHTSVELRSSDGMVSYGTSTRPDGAFAFGSLSPGTYILGAKASSDSPFGDSAERTISYTGAAISGVVLTLTNPFLTGTVTAPDMVTPISRTMVNLHSSDYMISRHSQSDDNGRFALRGVPDGFYVVETFPPMWDSPYFRSKPILITVTNGIAVNVTQPFTVALRAPSIAGTVVAPDGTTPISYTQVHLRSGAWSVEENAPTDEAGNFKLGDLDPPPGQYQLIADAPPGSGYSSSRRVVTVVSGATSYYTVTLRNPSLTGVAVMASGTTTQPVPFAGVTVRMRDNQVVADSTFADGAGQFAFGDLEPGVYWLTGYAPWTMSSGMEPPSPRLITIVTGSTLSETLMYGQPNKYIAGRVARRDGSAITDAMIAAYRQDGFGWVSGRADTEGRYRLNVGSGGWSVNLWPDVGGPGSAPDGMPTWMYDRPPTQIEIPAVAEEITRTLNFTVTSASSNVLGRLLKPDGNPPSMAQIGFHTVAGMGNGGMVDASGYFTVPLPPGTYRFEAFLPDSGNNQLTTPRLDPIVVDEGPDTNLGTIYLRSKGSRIQGRVQDPGDRGISGIYLGASRLPEARPDGSVFGSTSGIDDLAFTTSITDGVFSLYVLPGIWDIVPSPSPDGRYQTWGRPVRVEVGENVTASVILRVSAAASEITGSVVDEAGVPLADVNGFVQATTGSGFDSPMYGAPINAGTFSILLPAGNYTVEAQLSPGSMYTINSRPNVGVTTDGSTAITLTANGMNAWVAGALVDSTTGLTLTNLMANVFATGSQDRAFAVVDPSTGRYSMRVGEGAWFVDAHLDPSTGYVLNPRPDNVVDMTNGVTATYNFSVTGMGGTIWGFARDPGGSGLAGAWVEARATSGVARNLAPFGAAANSSGVYTITVPSGDYEITAFLPIDRGFLPPTPVSATVSSTVRRDLSFRSPGAAINGTVTWQGSPVSSGIVRGYSLGGARAYGDILSNGAYSLPVTIGDTWFIQAVREYSSTVYQSEVISVPVGSDSVVRNIALPSTGNPLPDATTVSFDASRMRVIVLGDGTEINIPAGALAVSGTVTVRAMPRGNVAMDSGARPIGLAYDLVALDGNSAIISRFRQNVAIVLHYTDEQLAALGITEVDVLASYWDEATGSWRRVASMVQDKLVNTLRVYVDHFSSWTIVAGAASAPGGPDLSTSLKTASASIVAPNQTFTYTITLANTGPSDASAAMTDTLPGQIAYASGSLKASSGAITFDEGAARVNWNGTVTANESVAITFQAMVTASLADGTAITNTARIVDGAGAVISASHSVAVFNPPVANFTVSPISGTLPLTVTFANQSTGSYTSSWWSFGDGATSDLTNPTHTYNATGVYTVALTVRGPGGSNAITRTSYITVAGQPIVTSVSPARAPASGGTTVTISGANFAPGASVTFDNALCSSVTVVSGTQITCVTPPHFPATVDVRVTNPGGQSGALLRAFTYEGPTAYLSAPNSSADRNAIIQIPITITNAEGLAAASFNLTFDSAVLNARSASVGTLSSGWSFAPNTSIPGQVRISMASADVVTGTGSLAVVEFEVVGSPGVTTTLHLANVSLNDGAIPAETTDGVLTVNLLPKVAGAVRFWNSSAPVPNVLLTLQGNQAYSTQTNASGTYTVTSGGAGAYTLTPSKSDGVNGISAFDASLVLRHEAGLKTLSGHELTAGDVNKSGAITAMDATYILQKAVDLIALPFSGAGVVWDFVPGSRSYSSLGADLANQDFTAVLIGDVSGNWSGGGGPSFMPQAEEPITLTLSRGKVGPSGLVTVTLIMDAANAQVFSLDLALGYSSAAVPVSVQPGPLFSGFTAGAKLSEPGLARMAMAGAVPASGSGEVVTLTFQMVDSRAGGLNAWLMRSDVNEGQTPVQVSNEEPRPYRILLPIVTK